MFSVFHHRPRVGWRAASAPARFLVLVVCLMLALGRAPGQIPLPEHPRPDWERDEWINLNGVWSFRFDKDDRGLRDNWQGATTDFPRRVNVPFSWAAPLSGLSDEADIGWYAREIVVPEAWRGRRVFLVVGAADWHTTGWLDGRRLGEHRGGYTPFEFELTPYLRPGDAQRLVLRVDDTPHPFKLEGKQGYGPARGIWQTPYLEARGNDYLEALHCTPDIAEESVRVTAYLPAPAPAALPLRMRLGEGENAQVVEAVFPAGRDSFSFTVRIPNARRWTLDDPHLYFFEARLGEGDRSDRVRSYFGMREISVVNLPGTDYRYVALNGRPVYLQMALDQAYHPEGFYTFPSDEFTRDEVLRSRRIGLNGMRVHVKVGLPRKLYWADRLGMLIMADVPNSWGEPDAEMRRETEYALRQMIRRDYNHPSIFSWVIFNETWGLFTYVDPEKKARRYLPETKKWVEEMYHLAKRLDPTRLVEDNSPCCGIGHTLTDLNTWHSYLPGWAWEEALARMDTATYPGGTWNFETGYRQGTQPNLNSEFGNVWGYEGSTGDVDWSWDYRLALNAFRRYPRVAGWLYTEHHDVINEWNGYWRYDRSEKITGIEELVPGMSLRDWHAPLYISPGGEASRSARPGETVEVPLFASFMSDEDLGDSLLLRYTLYGWDAMGRRQNYLEGGRAVPYRSWMQAELAPLRVVMPKWPATLVLAFTLEDRSGRAHHRNFTTFMVEGEAPILVNLPGGGRARRLNLAPAAFTEAQWSKKQWEALEGLKVNGAGAGFFEYRLPWPEDLSPEAVEWASFTMEASAKKLLGKDRDDAGEMDGDYMRGQGAHDPGRNPNAYPMTDAYPYPSAVRLSVNGHDAGRYELPDDPADHRGILSWHAQLQDRRLREAGSYGYLIQASIPRAALEAAARAGELILRLSVDEALPGGLAIYGARFGRYPLDPFVLLGER
jgi:hypothetical protein